MTATLVAMAASFFFYDLETSGISASRDRIMQFAGQRTNMNLQPIGDPINVMIKLAPDVLPSPDAILITGITPQQTLMDGLTEAEFLHYFYDEVVQPDTIFVGYNSIRFDDEFMRYLHYRNFYDPYEWQWKNGCSRWDILDVVRITRALRPLGINWPFTPEGKPTNKLELLTTANKLNHDHAHDALSDVLATIAVAKLIHDKQPELFKYLLGMRDKRKVAQLIEAGQPFVYTSGRYGTDRLHTTAALMIAGHTQQDAALVYDLCYDPTPFLSMTVKQLIAAWRPADDPDARRLPIKTVKYNRCPAIAPLGVIKDEETEVRLTMSLDDIKKHRAILAKHQTNFAEKIRQAVQQMDEARQDFQDEAPDDALNVDSRLYKGFVGAADKSTQAAVRVAKPAELSQFADRFTDSRLQILLPLYKARNFSSQLDSEERAAGDEYFKERLFSGGKSSLAAQYFDRLGELASTQDIDDDKRYLLEELQLYGQSILPADASD